MINDAAIPVATVARLWRRGVVATPVTLAFAIVLGVGTVEISGTLHWPVGVASAQSDGSATPEQAAAALFADALATACFVLGLSEGMRLIDSLPGVEALFVDGEQRVHGTTGARRLVSRLHPDYRWSGPAGDRVQSD